MATATVDKVAGLFTSPNELGSVPEGALVKADNCVIRSVNVIESRRGQEALSYQTAAQVKELFFYGGALLAHHGTTLSRDTGSAFTAYSGSYTGPDETTLRMKGAEAAQSFYFTTNAGVKVLDAVASTPAAAGVPRALDIYTDTQLAPSGLAGNPNASGSWLPPDSKVAYRVLFGLKDTNGRLLLGAPSGRRVVINPPDFTVAAGNLDRAADGTVITATTTTNHGLMAGDVINITDGGADFPAVTNEALPNTSVFKPTATEFRYGDVGTPSTSSAAEVTVTSGTKYTSFYVPLPSGITTSHFLRVYRSERTESAGVDSVPSDDMYLVNEVAITSTNVSNGYVAVTDQTPETALGSQPLYTNPSTGEGIINSNFPPPLAKDVTEWQGRLWFGNTTAHHALDIELLGVGSPGGVQDGDSFWVGGTQFVAKDEAFNDYEFELCTQYASASAELGKFYTALDLVRAINTYSGQTSVYAYYVSGENEPAGKIRLVSRTLGASTFYVGASRTASWNPIFTNYSVSGLVRASNVVTATTTSAHGFAVGQTVQILQVGSGGSGLQTAVVITEVPTATTFRYASSGADGAIAGTYLAGGTPTYIERSNNDACPNRLYYSKFQQPDAVPLLNYIDIGSKNHAIQRIVPLRDKLYVFKTDGIFVVSGDAPFRVDLLDETAKLLAPDSVVAVGNQIYALTYQGVVAVSDSGVALVSRPIETDILNVALANLDNAKRYSFGVGYESDRCYILFLAGASAVATEAYVYNYVANAWTRWVLQRSCGRVSPSDDKLYTGYGNSTQTGLGFYRERKEFSGADYRDVSSSVTVSSVSSNGGGSYTLAVSTEVNAGDVLAGSGWAAVVTDPGADQQSAVAVYSPGTPTTGSATHSEAISCEVAWAAQSVGAPSLVKQFRDCNLHFKRRNFYDADAKFTSDLSTGATSVPIVFTDRTVSTSVSTTQRVMPANKRMLVPADKQRAAYLQVGFAIAEAYSVWQLNGYSVEYDGASDKGNR